MRHTILLTGATGLVGTRVLRLMRRDRLVHRVYALTRRPSAFGGGPIVPLRADLGAPRLGVESHTIERLAAEVTAVVHCAANTSFAQSLDQARGINTEGTRQLLALTADFQAHVRWVHVSTAFVAGSRTGLVRETDVAAHDGFINPYEQSKAEAEQLVRATRPSAIIARSSTIVCDDVGGRITQHNAVHRALRLYFGGLAPMLPGCDDTTIDCVTADYVARGIVRLALDAGGEGETVHLCAGGGALPLDEALDVAQEVFSRSPRWQRRGIARPVRTDLETYRLFEDAVFGTGRERVKQALRSLGTFVPQLAYPKRFDTTRADALLGECAPRMRDYWPRMIARLADDADAQEAA